MTLDNARLNKTYKIVGFLGGPNLSQRLYSMGLYIGAKVQVKSVAPMRGPLIVQNIDNEIQIALGRGIIRKIEVVESDV